VEGGGKKKHAPLIHRPFFGLRDENAFVLNSVKLSLLAGFFLLKLLPVRAAGPARDSTLAGRLDSLENRAYQLPRLVYEAEYMSRVVYAGRDYGVRQWGLNHQLGFETAHWNVYAKAYRWSGLPNPWAKYDLGLSYHREFFGEKLSSEVSLERWWYANGSEADRQLLRHFAAAELEWDEDWAFLETDFYYMTGTERVRQANLTLGRYLDLYRVLGADKLELTPTLTATWADVGLAPINPRTNRPRHEPTSDAFGLANYELRLPVAWKKLGRFEGTLAWCHDWPQRRLKREINHPFSYVTVNLACTLRQFRTP